MEGVEVSRCYLGEQVDTEADCQSWRWPMTTVVVCILVIGGAGNVLTLLAVPYARRTGAKENVFLHTSSCFLLLHLSACDLLYCVLGLGPILYGLLNVADNDSNPFNSGGYGEVVCYFLALARHCIAYASFTTCGAIALDVARFSLCSECKMVGHHTSHDRHSSFWSRLYQHFFKKPKTEQKIVRQEDPNPDLPYVRDVYLEILWIWIVSLAVVSPDALGYTGNFCWRGPYEGCEANKVEEHTNYGLPILVLLNLVIIVGTYSLVGMSRLHQADQAQISGYPGADRLKKLISAYNRTMALLACVYLVLISPAMVLSWTWNTLKVDCHYRNGFRCLYWCLYGINSLLYAATNEQMRRAYSMFLRDMWRNISGQQTIQNVVAQESLKTTST